jgi:hypothetical protein
MLEARLSSLPVQITGPREAVERILAQNIIPGAQRRDCHSIVWIEAPEIPADIASQVRNGGCRLHHIESRSTAPQLPSVRDESPLASATDRSLRVS